MFSINSDYLFLFDYNLSGFFYYNSKLEIHSRESPFKGSATTMFVQNLILLICSAIAISKIACATLFKGAFFLKLKVLIFCVYSLFYSKFALIDRVSKLKYFEDLRKLLPLLCEAYLLLH